MKKEEKNIRRVSVSILDNDGVDQPINVVKNEVRNVLSTGVSNDEAEKIVTTMLKNSDRKSARSSIEVYSIPDDFKKLFVDPQ